MEMNEKQFKRWMDAKTRQYIWLVMRKDPSKVRVSFSKSFRRPYSRSHGMCDTEDKHIFYRTDYITKWKCDREVLEKLVIHEVCHLKHSGHGSNFFSEYKRWSGDDFIDRWCNSDVDSGDRFVSHIVGLPKVR